jgi:hypothetical protein
MVRGLGAKFCEPMCFHLGFTNIERSTRYLEDWYCQCRPETRGSKNWGSVKNVTRGIKRLSHLSAKRETGRDMVDLGQVHSKSLSTSPLYLTKKYGMVYQVNNHPFQGALVAPGRT